MSSDHSPSSGHSPSSDNAPSAGSADRPAEATIVQLTESGPKIDEFYHTVLEPSFHPDELCGLHHLQARVDRGAGDVWVALSPQGEVLAGLVGEWEPEVSIMLAAWIATRPGLRGRGLGGPLLDTALASWKARFDPCFVLAEIENPAHYTGDEAHGDPAARVAFYLRHGARKLDLPYFQPALGEAKQRVDNLYLMLLHAHPNFAGEEPNTLGGKELLEYMEAYLLGCEGKEPTDDQALRLLAAIGRPGGIPFLP